jgi:transcriptional regulator with XRE-family HTH domain
LKDQDIGDIVYFELLHSRLVDHLRGRVKSGELTERGLARIAGISQPHLHNVLKGVRVLSAPTADIVVNNLRLSILDLLREEEVAAGRRPALHRYLEIPLAAGKLGPAYPFPNLQETDGSLTLPAGELNQLKQPVAVRLAADPAAPDMFHAGDIVLLEAMAADQTLEPGAYYAIESGGGGLLRRMGNGPADPGSAAGVIRATAIWIGHSLRAPRESDPAV